MTVCADKNGQMVRPNSMRLAGFTASERTPFLFESSALIPHGVKTPCLGTISTPGTRTQQDARACVQSTTNKHQSLLEFLILAFYGIAEPRVGKVHFAHLFAQPG